MHGAIYSASFLSVISTPDCLMASPNDLTPSSSFNTSRKSQVSKVVKNSPYYILRPTVVGLTSGKVYDLGEDLSCANVIIL